jgi:hypothetical protein
VDLIKLVIGYRRILTDSNRNDKTANNIPNKIANKNPKTIRLKLKNKVSQKETSVISCKNVLITIIGDARNNS